MSAILEEDRLKCILRSSNITFAALATIVCVTWLHSPEFVGVNINDFAHLLTIAGFFAQDHHAAQLFGEEPIQHFLV